jgi:hypothetical protein
VFCPEDIEQAAKIFPKEQVQGLKVQRLGLRPSGFAPQAGFKEQGIVKFVLLVSLVKMAESISTLPF